MKMNKFFMLGLVGLAFAACNNEEEATNSSITGLSAVSIKIAAPEMTRTSPATPESPDKVKVTGEMTITLYSTGKPQGEPITLQSDQLVDGDEIVTFWNVEGPTKVTVSMNGGIADYTEVNITSKSPALQALPASIPVYGETEEIVTDGTSVTPGTYNKTNDDHQIGTAADGSDDDKTYQLYKATVNLEIPVARLEVSGIKHTHTLPTDDGNCQYSALTIDGVYLDNVKATDGGARGDYQFLDTGTGTGDEAILKEPIISASFLDGSTWPAAVEGVAHAYAFNFYGPTADEISTAGDDQEKKQALNPKFKIYFANATAAAGQDPVLEPRYAMITNYKDKAGNSIILQNGHIYRIVDATLDDKNIIGDEGGNTLVGVEVTVVEAEWTVETIEADWAE